MTPRTSAILSLVAGLTISLAPTRAADAAKPNIVLIMADDFGYECVTANGGQSYQTPHLDRLAAGGVRFEHCHVQPLCTPTRVQLMTGLYNVRNYLNFGTLPRSETTFGHRLKEAGYATGICGKWQLGHEVDSPQHFGFDESCLWQQTRRPPRYANPGLEYNGVTRDFKNGEYGPTLVNDFALDFITRHKGEPFFLYYPMILTHDPFQPTPDSPGWDPAAIGESVNKDVKHFADMTAYMDQLIGRVDAKLADLGIRDNTLLVFLGDNGTHSTVTSRFAGADYRGGKGTTTRRGTHVPLIASWPAVMTQGRVNQDLISSVDLFPTLCEAAGDSGPREDRRRQLSAATARRSRPAARMALLLVLAPPAARSDRARIRLRSRTQTLSRRPLLRPDRRSGREVAARCRAAHRPGGRSRQEAAGRPRPLHRRPSRAARSLLRSVDEAEGRHTKDEDQKEKSRQPEQVGAVESSRLTSPIKKRPR